LKESRNEDPALYKTCVHRVAPPQELRGKAPALGTGLRVAFVWYGHIKTNTFMIKYLNLVLISFLLSGCKPAQTVDTSANTPSQTLVVQKVADHVYQHISFLQTQSFGKVGCNGMVVYDQNEAIIFDTPADNSASVELIDWVEKKLKCKVKAIIPTHFHADCLGGLEEFHKRGIPSYANNATIKMAELKHYAIPQNGFDTLLELRVGERKVFARFFGEGHTRDNVIGYFPGEKVIFGGCLIKESGAGKGNLEDANVGAWSSTVAKLKEKYPDAKFVIPGHGKAGGTELFDYTIKLFEPK
jgi:metallo-beta-lactamase class B